MFAPIVQTLISLLLGTAVTPAQGPSQKLVLTETFVAGEDLSSGQFHFVKMNANRSVHLCDAITDIPVGVLQNKPASGEDAEVLVIGRSKVVAAETLAVADLIGTAADAEAAVTLAGTDSTVYIVGQVLRGASAGELAEVLVNCASPARAQ